MKILKTYSYKKVSNKNKEEWDPNPWGVCKSRIDENEEPEKFERCVKHIKKKQ